MASGNGHVRQVWRIASAASNVMGTSFTGELLAQQSLPSPVPMYRPAETAPPTFLAASLTTK